ncbi:MAG: hypothetical protein LBF12_00750, partial [Christensenellaceae bacterium]|nr:hypothetical protein [Christensenellaceae bacterium]
MYIIENRRLRDDKIYCYASETKWNPKIKKYSTPSKLVGTVVNSIFHPNNYFSGLIRKSQKDEEAISSYERLIVNTTKKKYGNEFTLTEENDKNSYRTARIEFSGPSLIFNSITKYYKLDDKLGLAFDKLTTKKILALAWFLASEGEALTNSSYWLDQFENPLGCALSSQDITRLLDSIAFDGVMTFYKVWLSEFANSNSKVLYDLTSISYYGTDNNLVSWGHSRDNDDLPQVNFGLVCIRNTGMPLFSWVLNGSISDVSTLKTTLEYLKDLNYKPDCLMLDRAFSTMENITYMLKNKQKFLQSIKTNALWIREIIDKTRLERDLPSSRKIINERDYYLSTTPCWWICMTKTAKNGNKTQEIKVIPKNEKFINTDQNVDITGKYACYIHILFCQDLVGNHKKKLTDELIIEYNRLTENKYYVPQKKYEKFFIINKGKNGNTVKYNGENIQKERNEYAGHVCYITNDKSIATAENALEEYSTRDYIEKDFDE